MSTPRNGDPGPGTPQDPTINLPARANDQTIDGSQQRIEQTVDATTVPAPTGRKPGIIPPGTIVGQYEVLALLGRGGFGDVYHVRETAFGQEAAMKLLHHASDEQERQLIEEGRKISKVHDSKDGARAFIAHISDRGTTHDGRFYIIQEYAPDGTLEQLIERDGFARKYEGTAMERLKEHARELHEQRHEPRIKTELDYLEQLLKANADGKSLEELTRNHLLTLQGINDLMKKCFLGLNVCHERGIVHRDLKPSNIGLRGITPKLLDFGIGRAEGEESDAIEGTLAYISPEQLLNKRVGRSADIYSMGMVLTTLILGKTARTEEEQKQLMNILNAYGAMAGKDALESTQQFRARYKVMQHALNNTLGKEAHLVTRIGAVAERNGLWDEQEKSTDDLRRILEGIQDVIQPLLEGPRRSELHAALKERFPLTAKEIITHPFDSWRHIRTALTLEEIAFTSTRADPKERIRLNEGIEGAPRRVTESAKKLLEQGKRLLCTAAAPKETPHNPTRAIVEYFDRRESWFKTTSMTIKRGAAIGVLLTALGTYFVTDPAKMSVSENEYLLGKKSGYIGDYTMAEGHLEEADALLRFRLPRLDRTKKDLAYLINRERAEIALVKGQYDLAKGFLQKLDKNDIPRSVRTADEHRRTAARERLFLDGMRLEADQDYAQAVQLYERLSEKGKDVEASLILIGLNWRILHKEELLERLVTAEHEKGRARTGFAEQVEEKRTEIWDKNYGLIHDTITHLERRISTERPAAELQLDLALLKIRQGWHEREAGYYDDAVKAYSEARVIAIAQGNSFLIGETSSALASLHYNKGEYATAERFAKEARKNLEYDPGSGALADSLDLLANISSILGRPHQGIEPALKAAEISRQNGNAELLNKTQYTLGMLFESVGKLDEAEAVNREGRKAAVGTMAAEFDNQLADITFHRGEKRQAEQLYASSFERFRHKQGERWKENYQAIYAHLRRAELRLEQGDVAGAAELLREDVRSYAGAIPYTNDLATILEATVTAENNGNDLERVLTRLEAIDERTSDPAHVAKASALTANLLAKSKDVRQLRRAAEEAERAAAEAKRCVNPYDRLETELLLIKTYLAMSKSTRGEGPAYVKRATRLAEELRQDRSLAAYEFYGHKEELSSLEKEL